MCISNEGHTNSHRHTKYSGGMFFHTRALSVECGASVRCQRPRAVFPRFLPLGLVSPSGLRAAIAPSHQGLARMRIALVVAVTQRLRDLARSRLHGLPHARAPITALFLHNVCWGSSHSLAVTLFFLSVVVDLDDYRLTSCVHRRNIGRTGEWHCHHYSAVGRCMLPATFVRFLLAGEIRRKWGISILDAPRPRCFRPVVSIPHVRL